jgi:serine/threonine-protein kinase
MLRSRLILGGLVGLLALLPSARAHAQASAGDKASAEALFDAALRAMKDGKFTEACPKLENSQRIDPGVGTLLYLGECYEKLGRTASAWATFREAESQAEASGQAKRAKVARERIAKLDPQLSFLTIEVADATRSLPGLRIRRDGTDAGLAIIGSSVPQDPGLVKIEATAPNHESFSLTVTVPPRGRQSVLIPALAAIEGPAATPGEQTPAGTTAPVVTPGGSSSVPSEPTPAPPAEESEPGSAQRVIGLVVAGAGVVGLGVGSYFGLSAIGHDKKADRACTPTLCQEQAGFDHADSARGQAVISNIGFIAGGGLLVAGSVLYLLAPSKPASGVSVTPLVSPGFAGVTLGGRL